jgi:hypothetical protein
MPKIKQSVGEFYMRAYRVKKMVSDQGKIQLEALPFPSGEIVDVIVLTSVEQEIDILPTEESWRTPASLKGSVLDYIDPLEPVAQNDWFAAQ